MGRRVVASPSRRKLFLDGLEKQDLDKFHPAVHDLATLWNSARNTLLKVFRFAPDNRTDSMYAAVYLSLYALCQRSSEWGDAPNLRPIRRLGHLTVPPSTLKNSSRGPADDEDYVPSEDENESRDLGVGKTQLGKRSQLEDSGSPVFVLLPAKKKQGGIS